MGFRIGGDIRRKEDIRPQQGNVAVLDQNILPLLFRAVENDGLQLAVVIKRVVLDLRHAAGDHDGGQLRAAVERAGIDGGHPVRDIDKGQLIAIFEGVWRKLRNRIQQGDLLQYGSRYRHSGQRVFGDRITNH